jgi:hypothetical protein
LGDGADVVVERGAGWLATGVEELEGVVLRGGAGDADPDVEGDVEAAGPALLRLDGDRTPDVVTPGLGGCRNRTTWSG